MAKTRQKDTNSTVGTGIAGAAGFVAGAATVVAAVALSNKDNRKKAGKAIQDLQTKVMDMKQPAKAKIEEVKDTAKQVAENYKN